MKTSQIITGVNNQILRNQSKVLSFNESKKIIKNLRNAIEDKNALGIASPQIGINIRVILTKLGKNFIVMINPKILQFSEKTEIDEEGCLSLPDTWGKVERAKEIVVEFIDEKGKKKILNLQKIDARIVQHEIDHLDGILFVDRIVAGSNLLFD